MDRVEMEVERTLTKSDSLSKPFNLHTNDIAAS